MERETAIRILKSRLIINAPGKYSAKCTSANAFEGKFIANFNAMNGFQFAKAKELVKADDLEKACNINLSASLLPGMFVPAKGEIVHITVDYVTTKSGEQALLISGVTPVPVQSASKADWGFDDELVNEPELEGIGEKDAEE